jgi:hypothetical protein
VYLLIVRIVRERADAAGVLPEVFWKSWQSAGAYDATRGMPEAWIVHGGVRRQSTRGRIPRRARRTAA